MLIQNPNWVKRRVGGTLLAVILLVQISGVAVTSAQAEDFVSNAFQNQWNSTDADIASGKVARTFFWGPQAFAHTQEVYSETVTGTREVQYFDKGRMELTKRPNQDPNAVTNGLLVSEMVSGQMQLGDNTFVQRPFSDIPVAGDPEGSPDTPTYGDFNRSGLLKPGSPDSSSYGDRTGGLVDQTLARNSTVLPLRPLPTNVKYAKYIPNTHHNIADVFYNFFLAAPLGEDKWLPVMGFPISEAYWITATVAGKNQLVLAQMFERRALTYTPGNPSGFQVEMANVGQHYYQWRYGTNLHSDTLPGNYRLLLPQGKSLVSSSIYSKENFKVADAPQFINGLWPSSNGLAIVEAGYSNVNGYNAALYFADLTKPGQFKELPLNPGVQKPSVEAVNWSRDGSRAVVTYTSQTPAPTLGYSMYEKTVVSVYYFDGPNLVKTLTNFDGVFYTYSPNGVKVGPQTISLSHDGRYLVLGGSGKLIVLNLVSRSQASINLPANTSVYRAVWMDNIFSTLMVEYSTDTSANNPIHKIALVDITDDKLIERGSGENISGLSVSPDGNILAILSGSGTDKIVLSFRNINGQELGAINLPVTVASYSGIVGASFVGWAADSSYLALGSRSGGPAGSTAIGFFLVSPIGSKILNASRYTGDYLRSDVHKVVAPYYIVNTIDQDYPVDNGKLQKVSVQNVDGSNTVTLFEVNNRIYKLDQAQVVQVPLTR